MAGPSSSRASGIDGDFGALDLFGLRGDRVVLVPPDRTRHLENALRWMNDPAATAKIAHHLGVTRRQEEAFFDRIEEGVDDEMHWAIHLADDRRHVGFIGLQQIRWRERSAVGGLLLGDRTVWGQGYGTDAVRTRTHFAFEQLGLHRIEGHTINPAMRRVYEKCGYRHEGTARQKLWRDGRWHDAELFAILEGDYFGDASMTTAGDTPAR